MAEQQEKWGFRVGDRVDVRYQKEWYTGVIRSFDNTHAVVLLDNGSVLPINHNQLRKAR